MEQYYTSIYGEDITETVRNLSTHFALLQPRGCIGGDKVKKALMAGAFGLLIALQTATAQVVVRVAPPPPRREVVVVSPGPRYAWTGGYYRWRHGAYVWVPGRYVVPPRPHAVWVPGYWVPRRSGYVWVAGYWR